MVTTAAQFQPPADATAEPAPPRSRTASVILLLRFAAVMAVLLSVASLPASALFAVRAVRVQGAVHVPATEIVALAAVRPGDRLAAVTPAEVGRRVLRHPRVAEAAVRTTRSGVVLVRVHERIPFAACPVEGHYLILDRTGVIIDDQPSSLGLPVVAAADFTPAWIRLGDRIPSGGVHRALAALPMLPRQAVTPGTRVRAQPDGDLVLLTPDGIVVRLGPLRGLEQRAALMEQILSSVRARGLGVEYLDLRFSGSVVMKPLPDAPAGEDRGR